MKLSFCLKSLSKIGIETEESRLYDFRFEESKSKKTVIMCTGGQKLKVGDRLFVNSL